MLEPFRERAQDRGAAASRRAFSASASPCARRWMQRLLCASIVGCLLGFAGVARADGGAGLEAARLAFEDSPGEATDLLLSTWLRGEKADSAATTRDADAALGQLALLFAQLALSPPEELAWSWHSPESTSHAPRTPTGILAARWSFFFTERRAHRAIERLLASGEEPLRPAETSGLTIWTRAAARASEAFTALRVGALPDDAPDIRRPLLSIPADSAELAGRDCARLPWLAAPPDIAALTERLQREGGSIVRYAVFEEVTLTYLIQADRLRLISTPVARDSLAARVRRYVPYAENGCSSANLSSLPEDFELGGELFHWFLAPLGESVDLSQPIWISADGPLWYLPFEALAPRGAPPRGPDKDAIWDRASTVPLAIDRHRIGYVVDPGVLAPALFAEATPALETELDARIVLPSLEHADSLAVDRPAAAGGCGGAEDVAWRQPPCEPDAATIAEILAETDGIAITAHLSKAELSAAPGSRATVFFAPTLYEAGPDAVPARFALSLDQGARGDITAAELARLPLGRFCALPEGSACPLSPAAASTSPQSWGLEILWPALAADWAGCESLYQSLWNVGEASWIPLVSLLAHPGGPSFELFTTERKRLRSLTLPAGPGHRLSLSHPYFSCAVRWWRLTAR